MNEQKALAMLKAPGYEGVVDHMYLDTRGFVTVGVGQLLATAHDATALAFYHAPPKPHHPPVHHHHKPHVPAPAPPPPAGPPKRATNDEVTAEWTKVKALPFPHLASYYAKYTTLIMLPADIDALLLTRIRGFVAALKGHFTGWDKFPEPAQLALLDMEFNLGDAGLFGHHTKPKHGHSKLVGGFPTVVAAAQKHDWLKCAANCHRRGPGEHRNAETKQRFELAAKLDPLAPKAQKPTGSVLLP